MSTIIFRNHRSADCAGTVLLRRLSHEHHDQQPLPPHQPPQSMARRRSRSALRGMGAGGRRHAPARRVDGAQRSRGMTSASRGWCLAARAARAALEVVNSPRTRSARSSLGSTVGTGSDTGAGTSTRQRCPRAGLRPAWTCHRTPGSAICEWSPMWTAATAASIAMSRPRTSSIARSPAAVSSRTSRTRAVDASACLAAFDSSYRARSRKRIGGRAGSANGTAQPPLVHF